MANDKYQQGNLCKTRNINGLQSSSLQSSNIHGAENVTNLEANKGRKYIIGKEIGKGAYAIVKLITNRESNETYAMKIYEKHILNDQGKKNAVTREIQVMKRIDHKNIARGIEVISTNKQIGIIMEFVKGISLRNYYNNSPNHQVPEYKCKPIFAQILDAMGYLHKHHIAHRDIKGENIGITSDNVIKIIDFGFSVYCEDDSGQNFFCGTPNYMPPEIILKRQYRGDKADIWSGGVLFYKMGVGEFPFKGSNEKELYKVARKGVFYFPSYLTDEVKKVIKNMILGSPEKRVDCCELGKFDFFGSL